MQAFVENLRHYSGAKLKIIGYGPERDSLKKFIDDSEISDSIEIIDSIEHDKLPEIYRQARVLALPSLIPEGLGLTVAEAAACSVPSITFGLGGTADLVINEKTGLIVDPDVKSLSDGIARLMGDNNLVDTMGKDARKYVVDKFGWDSLAGRFDLLFREIVSNAKAIKDKSFSKSAKIMISSIIVITVAAYLIKTFVDRIEKIIHIMK